MAQPRAPGQNAGQPGPLGNFAGAGVRIG